MGMGDLLEAERALGIDPPKSKPDKLSNSMQQLTEYQALVLAIAADSEKKHLIMLGTTPDSSQETKDLGAKNLREVDALVGMGWLMYAPEEDYADHKEIATKHGCSCVGYLVPPRTKTMFKTRDKVIN